MGNQQIRKFQQINNMTREMNTRNTTISQEYWLYHDAVIKWKLFLSMRGGGGGGGGGGDDGLFPGGTKSLYQSMLTCH